MEFMTVDQINIKLIALVRNERKLTEEILNHIILFQKCSGFLKLGYSSMHQYLTRMLGYSDDQAYRRLKAAKLLHDVPEVADQLKSGEINLSQAAQTQQAIETSQKETKNPVSVEKKKKIIKAIKKINNFETKKILNSELDLKPKLDEKLIPQSNKTLRLEVNLTLEQFEKFKNIKNLLSHKIHSQNTTEILEVLFDMYLNKNSITKESKVKNSSTTRGKEQSNSESLSNQKASCSDSQSIITKRFMDSRNTSDLTPPLGESMEEQESEKNSRLSTEIEDHPIKSDKNSLGNTAATAKKNNLNRKTSKRSRYIPIHTRRRIFERANHCCEFTGPNEERCQNRYQLEIDHFVKPYSQGGDHSLDNLKLHCSQHNAHRASLVGIGFETIHSFNS